MDTLAPAVRKHDWFIFLGMPLAAAATLLWPETTDLDRGIASWFFDSAAGGSRYAQIRQQQAPSVYRRTCALPEWHKHETIEN